MKNAQTKKLVVGALLLTLLAGCGGSNQSGDENTEKALTLVPCLTETELVLLAGPIDLTNLYVINSGEISGVTISGLSGPITLEGLNFPQITLSGHSVLNQTETRPLTAKAVAKDGLSIALTGDLEPISVGDTGSECTPVDSLSFIADGIADHDTGSFPNSENPYAISAQTRELTVTLNGYLGVPVPLSADRLDGILFNGVPIQMREAICAGSHCDQSSGAANPLYEPALYGIDDHNAHVLNDGSYHYHGDPHTLYDEPTDSASPVIGFAADGLPIYGPWINDGGAIRKASSSYQLRTGYRPEPYDAYPYDGSFVDDYEYVADSGDLDMCNGMYVNGVYGYVVTDTFPYVLNCLRREPDPSFDLITE